jgi:archaellum biogenesis ATPase FlaH/predicted transcriptional regulator
MQNELNNNQESFCNKAKMSLYSFPITETDSKANITPFELFVKVKYPEFEKIINEIRGLEDEKEQDHLKTAYLPTVTPSGIYSKRNQVGFIEHTGIICLDFDHIENLVDFKQKILSDSEIETLLLFLSPSGLGYKWFVRIPNNVYTHISYFNAIKHYLKVTYDFEIDNKCKNISRPCFLSHDPEAFLNFTTPKELGSDFLDKWMPNVEEKSYDSSNKNYDSNLNIKRVKSVVDQLVEHNINLTEDYEDWLNIGFSLCQLDESGRDFFHQISKISSKYEANEVDAKYSSLLSNYNEEITLGTFFFLAEQYGVKPIVDKNMDFEVISDNSLIPLKKKLRTMPERLADAKKLPKIQRLLGNIWCKGEVHILFGDNGTGKSVWATQIANALTKGENTFWNLPNEAGVQKVLFYDFELSDVQLMNRYSDNEGNVYPFNSNLTLDSLDFSDPFFTNGKGGFDKLIIKKIKEDIVENKPDILIIDNITFLKTEALQEGKVALELIKALIEFKKEYSLSILILAHTPKVPPGSLIINNHLAGSKHLSNLADSMSTIGISASDKNVKYIKSVKCRSTEKEFDANNVILVKQEKLGCFLQFTYLEQGSEYSLVKDPMKIQEEQIQEEVRNEVIYLHQQGLSYRKIADQTNLNKNKVNRIIKDHGSDSNIEL